MVDAALPSGSNVPLGSPEELREVWDRFRSGSTIACPTDGSPMALSVDGSSAAYRFVCTACGTASAWFESGPGGLAVRILPVKASPQEG
jgi:hypothetical protein